VTRRSEPFLSFLFAFYSQFSPICRDLYYVFTTEGGNLLSRQKSTEQTKSKNDRHSSTILKWLTQNQVKD
jgi:hypothetical protein